MLNIHILYNRNGEILNTRHRPQQAALRVEHASLLDSFLCGCLIVTLSHGKVLQKTEIDHYLFYAV